MTEQSNPRPKVRRNRAAGRRDWAYEWPGHHRRFNSQLTWDQDPVRQIATWPPLLLVADVARALQMHSNSIARMCRRKEIACAHKSKNKFVIPKTVVLNILGYIPDMTVKEHFRQSLFGVSNGKVVHLPPLITMQQALCLLRTSDDQIGMLIHDGLLVGRVFGGRWYISTRSIVDALTEDRFAAVKTGHLDKRRKTMGDRILRDPITGRRPRDGCAGRDYDGPASQEGASAELLTPDPPDTSLE